MLRIAVRRAFASSLLSFLLLVTLGWGGCISCEQYFMFGGEKNCCSPDGHCKTQAPAQSSKGECNQIAIDHHKPVDLHLDLPVIAAAPIEWPVLELDEQEHRRGSDLIEPSPPDLQVLHSTFLI